MVTAYPTALDALVAKGWVSRVAASPVSIWAIRAWCAAIGQFDSRYIGSGLSSNNDVVAPPPMLQCWAGPGLMPDNGHDITLHAQVRRAFRQEGFRSVVATDYEQSYVADLRPGDVVHERSRIVEISPLKQTRLGRGHFVQIEFLFATSAGLEVGKLRVRTFYFIPGALPVAVTARPIQPELLVDAVESPPSFVRIDRTLVIAGSIASNDFEKVHHDEAVAHADGLSDIILSIVTTAGLVWRYALEAAPPQAVIRSLALRLGTPAVPGDQLYLKGVWATDEDVRRLAITGTVTNGGHVQATVEFDRRSNAPNP